MPHEAARKGVEAVDVVGVAELEPAAARFFLLSTGSLSALGYEHARSQPVIRLWNNVRHLGK
jgi:hypothetical protein